MKHILSNTIYIYDDANDQFQTWNGVVGNITDGLIDPFQGFFIEGSGGSGALSMTEGAIADSGGTFLKRNPSTEPRALKLTATAGDITTNAWISFQEGGEKGKDRFDGRALLPLTSTYLQLGTLEGDDLLQINAQANNPETSMMMPLIIQGRGTAGEGVLSFEGLEDFEGWEFRIRDNELEEEFPITEGETITLDVEIMNAKAVPTLTLPVPTPMKVANNSTRYELIMQPAVSVSTEEPSTLPTEVTLDQNFPNPFNPTTNISFTLPQAGEVRLQVFDLLGREVSTLVNARQAAGRFTVQFDASALSSGVYIYRLQAAGAVLTRKLTLIK